MGENKNEYWILVGKHEGKKTFERHGPRREYNIYMYFKEIGLQGMG
jgi:hypothetical protein